MKTWPPDTWMAGVAPGPPSAYMFAICSQFAPATLMPAWSRSRLVIEYQPLFASDVKFNDPQNVPKPFTVSPSTSPRVAADTLPSWKTMGYRKVVTLKLSGPK